MTPAALYTLYAAFVLGGTGLYFLLPNPDRGKPLAGAALGALGLVALVVAWALIGDAGTGAAFYVLGLVALLCTVRVITHPKPVYSALYFVLTVLAVAALCVLQGAEFLAAALVIIYAGAILVTYVFVIMLAQQSGPSSTDRRSREPFLSVCAGFVTMAVITAHASKALESSVAAGGTPRAEARLASAAAESGAPAGLVEDEAKPSDDGAKRSAPKPVTGNAMALGGAVMTRYMVALQLSGLLLLIAMVGAVAMSRKRVPQEGAVSPRAPLGQAGREVPPY
ncbi:MAG: NADH-quinone oxidoreductase subunit J [Phycisphaerae bacterium]|nr:NADH-quinone oxidoreductase subunit J [Phycisphaerae bacterium]NUQ08924.1 NADH-quinone oxidoreductase subunit J [Phycisphaerae bacterium]